MFEDAIEASWSHWVGPNQPGQPIPLWHRCVGYLWTFIFMCWSTPKWIYPNIERYRPDIDEVYPFGIARYIKRK